MVYYVSTVAKGSWIYCVCRLNVQNIGYVTQYINVSKAIKFIHLD